MYLVKNHFEKAAPLDVLELLLAVLKLPKHSSLFQQLILPVVNGLRGRVKVDAKEDFLARVCIVFFGIAFGLDLLQSRICAFIQFERLRRTSVRL